MEEGSGPVRRRFTSRRGGTFTVPAATAPFVGTIMAIEGERSGPPDACALIVEAFEGIMATGNTIDAQTLECFPLSMLKGKPQPFETDVIPPLVFLLSTRPEIVHMVLCPMTNRARYKKSIINTFFVSVVLATVLGRALHAVPLIAHGLSALMDTPGALGVVDEYIVERIWHRPPLRATYSFLLASLSPYYLPKTVRGGHDDPNPLRTLYIQALRCIICHVSGHEEVEEVAAAHAYLLNEAVRRTLEHEVHPPFLLQRVMTSSPPSPHVDTIPPATALWWAQCASDEAHAQKMKDYGDLDLLRYVISGRGGGFSCSACKAPHTRFECERCRRPYCGAACQAVEHGKGKKCSRTCHVCRITPLGASQTKTCSDTCRNRRALRLHRSSTAPKATPLELE
jgi:hypothetical protein